MPLAEVEFVTSDQVKCFLINMFSFQIVLNGFATYMLVTLSDKTDELAYICSIVVVAILWVS